MLCTSCKVDCDKWYWKSENMPDVNMLTNYYVIGCNMETDQAFLEKLKFYGIGRRKLDDKLFINDKAPPRLGVYNFDEENLCHEVIKSICNVPGCTFAAESLLEFENHYNSSHRYVCAQCKKNLPSPHLLDLHIQETHDSFFAVLAEKRPSYCCYIEECKEKFNNADKRMEHCIREHKLPKDFRFESKPRGKIKNTKNTDKKVDPMDLDSENIKGSNKILLMNSKQKTFTKYTGRKFTKTGNENDTTGASVNMDTVITDLKDSLPK